MYYSKQSRQIDGLCSILEDISETENKWNFSTYSWYTLKKKYNIDTLFTVDVEATIPFSYTARGLYYQLAPYQQAILMHCTSGAVLVIAVDLRKDSSSFCAYNSHILEAQDKSLNAVYIPRGCAYGFITLDKNTVIRLKSDNYFEPLFEKNINLADQYFDIHVPYPDRSSQGVSFIQLLAQNKIIISVEDRNAPWLHKLMQDENAHDLLE